MKIKNVEDLRNHLLSSIEKVQNKKMNIEELSILSKASEAIFSSVKMQLTYNGMRKEVPNIEFLQDSNDGKIVYQNKEPLKLEK